MNEFSSSGRKPFRSTRYMYLLDWKETLPIRELLFDWKGFLPIAKVPGTYILEKLNRCPSTNK
jgi:hypothetical protein